jgi:hypothetical protein
LNLSCPAQVYGALRGDGVPCGAPPGKRLFGNLSASFLAERAVLLERWLRELAPEALASEPGPGQQKRAKFPTSKAPISAVFHSFRLILGRAIISRNGLEAWKLFQERARAKHSR